MLLTKPPKRAATGPAHGHGVATLGLGGQPGSPAGHRRRQGALKAGGPSPRTDLLQGRIPHNSMD
jgi:hypothetical protein